jgi:hypothetical protein
MFERMTPKLMLMDDRAPVEQMIFRPLHRLFSRASHHWHRVIGGQRLNCRNFSTRHLFLPERLQSCQSHVLDFPRPFLMRDMLPNVVDVPVSLSGSRANNSRVFRSISSCRLENL